MKNTIKEKKLLTAIKYGPIILVLILSFTITQIMLINKKQNFDDEIKTYEETFMNSNKLRIEKEVDVIYNYILYEKNNAEKYLKKSIKNEVYEAHQIAMSIYNRASSNNHSEKYILNSIKNTLTTMTHNQGRGYIFMHDVNGMNILQPFNKELEGENFLEYEDANGYKFVRKIVETIKNKTENFDSYYWNKKSDKSNTFKKISFYKYFEPLNLAIGTGEYIEEFEDELKEKVLERIQNIRNKDSGYIFIYDIKGNCLAHYKKDLIGINRFNYQDKDDNFLVQDIINTGIEKKSAFISYKASNIPNENMSSTSKISFIKIFEEWGWVIGTGFYTETLTQEIEKKKNKLEKSNKKALKYILSTSIIITIIFILLSFIVSKLIKLRFDDYKANFQKEFEESIKKEKLLVQQSKMASMGEMIANIAHQWKQPLSIINLSSGLIKLNKENNTIRSKENIDKAFENIENSVAHLSSTIDDFKNFFNPNKQKKSFKIQATFEKSFKLLDSIIKDHDIEIISNIHDVQLYTFENELLQVIINILKNAIDELVKIEKNKRFIFINVTKIEENIYIFIKDSAGGIREEIVNKIFDSYFTTKIDDEGNGIGLYMSKQIIISMRGTINAKNTIFNYQNIKYQGAEFSISIFQKTFSQE